MNKTKKFIVGLLAALCSFVMLFGFSGCCSEHNATLQYDDKYGHYEVCSKCAKKLSSNEEHTLILKHDEDKHWDECYCGYKYEWSHAFFSKGYNKEAHWGECRCGYKGEEEVHTFINDICSSCPYTRSLSKEEYMAKCNTTYTYDMLARYPDRYYNHYVMFIGEVEQISRNGNTFQMRVNITKKGSYYTDDIWVNYTQESDENFLENDIIQFYGRFKGDYTYTTVLGASRTIPQVNAAYISLVSGMFD